MIETVFFDWDWTLIRFNEDEALLRAAKALGNDLGGRPEPSTLLDRLTSISERMLARGIHDRNAWWLTLDAGLGLAARKLATSAYWRAVRETTEEYPGAAAVLDELKRARRKVGLITDGDGSPGLKEDRVRTRPIASRFDVILVAGQSVSQGKLSGEIFKDALEATGTAAHCAAMIGDKVEADLIPAERLDILTILRRNERNRHVAWPRKIEHLCEIPVLLAEVEAERVGNCS